MTFPTQPVTVTLVGQDGAPYVGVTVHAKLDQNEIYQGVVIASDDTAVTNGSGVAVLNLFPNAPVPTGLGTRGSVYRFRAMIVDGKRLDVTAQVPNSPCTLESIAIVDPLPALDAAAAAVLGAQAAAGQAGVSAGQASASAVAAAISEGNASSSAGTAAGWAQTALDWASKVAGAVAGGLFSAKEYAQGSQAATGGSSKNWAQQTASDVTGAAAGSRSAKSWAQEDIAGATLGGSAKDWAQSGSKPDAVNESAKTYAGQAGVSAGQAITSAAAALVQRNAIDSRLYPGVYTAAPTTRPDGTAIQNGDYYFNSTGNLLYVRNAGVWTQQTAASTADLANSSDIAKGSALVGHRGTTAQVSIDDRHRNLKLNKLKNALSDIITNGAGVASLAIFGDSVARHPIPDEVMLQLYRTYGWRGAFCTFRNAFGGALYSLGNLSGGTASGTGSRTDYTAWPAGNLFNMTAAGNRVRFGILPSGIHPFPYVNRATILYVKKPGGGTFKVQAWTANDGVDFPVDQGAVIDTNAASVQLATVQVNLTRAIGPEVSALWQSGDVDIVGCLLEDTTAAGLIISYLDSGGLDMDQSNTCIQANLSTLLNLIAPNLITWAMKDLNVGTKLPVHQALWDAAYATDWLYITPYPDNGTPTEQGARANADAVIQHAIANGHDWYDTCIDIPSYAYATARGWMADVTHLNTKGVNVLSSRFARATGLLPAFRASATRDNVNARVVSADSVLIAGVDQATTSRQVRGQEIARSRGLRFASGQNQRLLSEVAITAVGTGDFTLLCAVRVPTGAPSLIEFCGVGGTNGNSTGGSLWFGATSAALTFNYRLTDNSANVILQATTAGPKFWSLAGEIVMLALRRNTAPASGEAPYTAFINGVSYPVSGQSVASLLQDMSATWFKVGALTQVPTQNVDMFGAALYRSALTDAALLTAYQQMDFPTGYEIYAPMTENKGAATGKPGEKRSHVIFDTGVTWLNPDIPTFRRTLPWGGQNITLRSNDCVINDYNGSATRYTYTLPAAPALGDYVEVVGYGQGGWRVGQPAGHQILEGAGTTVGTNASTAGVTGYIQSANRYDSCRLRCVIADSVTPSYIWVVERRSGCTFA